MEKVLGKMLNRDGYSMWRVLTAHVRWLAHFSNPLLKSSSYLLLKPPLFKTQVVKNLRSRRKFTIKTKSYYDWATVMEVFAREEYLPSSSPFTRQLDARYAETLSEGKTPLILDFGANIGVASIQFAERFPRALIVAIEPSKDNFESLTRNTQDYKNVLPERGAIALNDGEVKLYLGPKSANNAFRTFATEGTEAFESVIGMSPKSLITTHSRAEPFLVKIDIEGFEAELFKKDARWLDGFPFIMTELHDWMLWGQASSNAMIRSALKVDRDIFISGENLLMARPHPLESTKSENRKQRD